MSNDEKFNLCTSYLSVSQCLFSAFLRAESAISEHSGTGRVKSKIVDIFVLGFELSTKTTSFSVLLLQNGYF